MSWKCQFWKNEIMDHANMQTMQIGKLVNYSFVETKFATFTLINQN